MGLYYSEQSWLSLALKLLYYDTLHLKFLENYLEQVIQVEEH